MSFKKVIICSVVAATAFLGLPRTSQAADANSVTVADQVIHTGVVVVEKVVAEKSGWMVIHATTEGAPAIGWTYLHAGENDNVAVKIDMSKANETLMAMLHVDEGTAGVYEFPGADVPIFGADKKPISPMFKVIGVDVDDQFVTGKTVTLARVIAQEDGWIAIHSGADGFPVIGTAPIKAGAYNSIVVDVDPTKVTERMTAMIHIDAGEKGKYEFPGADVPAAFNKDISNEPFWTADHVRVAAQLVGSDNIVTVPYVLAKVDGWMVIHSTADGFPVIGKVAVKAGLNSDVKVTIDDPKTLTATVLAMLHIDAGKVGEYEFPGADVPVMGSDGKPVSPAVLVGEGVMVNDQTAEQIKKSGYVTVKAVVSAKNGWIVIHSGADGFPVIGQAFVHAGANENVMVPVKVEGVTDSISAMLHVDAGTAGVYEFPGADAPVKDAAGKIINPAISTTAMASTGMNAETMVH